jgi:hypothetical protein
MIPAMPNRLRCLLFILCLTVIACGSSDPDLRMPDWDENFDRARHASEAGQHAQAMAVAEAYLKKYPDNVDGHRMVADAAMEAARAASDASRAVHFERAVTHHARSLELSKNPNWRLLALTGLIEVYGTRGLNRPDEVERYARLLIAEDPTRINNYSALVFALRDAKRFDELAALLADAGRAIRADESGGSYGILVHDVVAFAPGFPHETGRKLLAEAAALLDQALKKQGRTEMLLMTKGSLLREQARLEPDADRQRALLEESKRTFDEMDALAK